MNKIITFTVFAMFVLAPMSALAANYYFTITGTAGGRQTAIHGPFARLIDCQEAQAKVLGRATKDSTVSGCYTR
jgi:hypothetical protein